MRASSNRNERLLTNLCALIMLWMISWVVAGYAARCAVILFCIGYGC